MLKSALGGIETLMGSGLSEQSPQLKSALGGIETLEAIAGVKIDVKVKISPWRD